MQEFGGKQLHILQIKHKVSSGSSHPLLTDKSKSMHEKECDYQFHVFSWMNYFTKFVNLAKH